MTFFEAAKRVLKEADGTPMHYKDIARTAIKKGYIESKGITPDATMGAQLYEHIRRATAAGRDPEVRQIGRGKFALARKQKFGLDKDIEDWNKRIRKELLEALMELDPRAFEHLAGSLLVSIGFEDVNVTKFSGDGGIDVEAELTVGGVTNVKTAVQVKRWRKNVSGRTVRELRGGQLADQRGLIITTSDFTKDAVVEASAEGKTPISLINGEKLIDLLVENDIGITKRSLHYLELDLSQIDVVPIDPDPKKQKYLGLWPLPGGTDKYAETSKTMLEFIMKNEPDLDSLRDWIREEFPTVRTEKALDGYLRVLRMLGLTEHDGQEVCVTDAGKKVIEGNEKSELTEQLKNRIAGIEELIAEFSKRDMDEVEACSFLKETLKVDWESLNQTKFRLLWLVNTGVLHKEGSRYYLIS